MKHMGMLGRNWLLQQHNDPKDRIHLVPKWLIEKSKCSSFSIPSNIFGTMMRKQIKKGLLHEKFALHEVIRMNANTDSLKIRHFNH